MELGMRAWFLGPMDDTPQRKSRRPRTNEASETNGKVDREQASRGRRGHRGPTVERCTRCSVTELSHQTFDTGSGEPLRHTWAAIGPQPPMPPACATAPAASVERLFILFRPLFLLPAQRPTATASTTAPVTTSSSNACCYARCYCWSNRCTRYCPATLHYHTAPPR